ncbi:hypothetical protein [Corallococcus sp. 4LFB]|uniref:hypothetical protein n=1 Tax=Corallococcus sp. 4LFB TaxID=3383249 RepID=UPI0039755B28
MGTQRTGAPAAASRAFTSAIIGAKVGWGTSQLPTPAWTSTAPGSTRTAGWPCTGWMAKPGRYGCMAAESRSSSVGSSKGWAPSRSKKVGSCAWSSSRSGSSLLSRQACSARTRASWGMRISQRSRSASSSATRSTSAHGGSTRVSQATSATVCPRRRPVTRSPLRSWKGGAWVNSGSG